jgi:hypothetical protein
LVSLALLLNAVAPVFALDTSDPDSLPRHDERDISPLYNGIPLGSTYPSVGGLRNSTDTSSGRAENRWRDKILSFGDAVSRRARYLVS